MSEPDGWQPHVHASWLHRLVPDGRPDEGQGDTWELQWCVLYATELVWFSDDACSEMQGSVALTVSSRISRFDVAGFVIDVNPAAGEARCLSYFDAGDAEACSAWITAVEHVTQNLAALQDLCITSTNEDFDEFSNNPPELYIDDFSDYEDDDVARKSSFQDLDTIDWVALPQDEPSLPESAADVGAQVMPEIGSACERDLPTDFFEIDDFSDYEDPDSRLRTTSFSDLEVMDWTEVGDACLDSDVQPLSEGIKEIEQGTPT